MAFEGLKTFFSNSFETNDFSEKVVATHYYGNDYITTKSAVTSLLKKMGFLLIHADDNYRELLFSKNKQTEIIVTISKMSYYEHGVDMKITTKYFIPCGRTKKLAKKIYEDLNKSLIIKKTGGSNEYY